MNRFACGCVGAVLMALAMVWISTPARAAERSLTPLAQRTTDEVIAADLRRIDALRAKLGGLEGARQDPWRAAYAEALLEAVREEYADNDTTPFTGAALARAAEMIGKIESGAPPVTRADVPKWSVPAGSSRLRPDLWTALDSLKQHAGFPCAREEVARFEAALVWAGNEGRDQGDCHTAPHVAEAEDWGRRARLKAEACIETVPVQRPVPPPAAVIPAPVALPTAEELEIPRDVHFALSKWNITEASLQVIGGITAVLQKYPGITILLEGHTDSRGSSELNIELSRKRVMSVKDVFVMIGIDSSRIQVSWKGKGELYAPEDSKKGFALNRRVELVFLDPAGQRIKATRQESDLQIEGDRVKAPAPVTPRPVRKPVKKPAAVKKPGTP